MKLLNTTSSMCPHYRIKVESRHPAEQVKLAININYVRRSSWKSPYLSHIIAFSLHSPLLENRLAQFCPIKRYGST